MPLEITARQRGVWEALQGLSRRGEAEKFPLEDWYLVALYALANPHNPDRVSQAAQSLRELLEKIPLVVPGIDVQEKSRRQKIQTAVTSIGPTAGWSGESLQREKSDLLHKLRKQLNLVVHHRSIGLKEFFTHFRSFEDLVFDLLTPVTAHDQHEIFSIVHNANISDSGVERLFSLIEKRESNLVFFFKQIVGGTDSRWISALNEHGYFDYPPGTEPASEGEVRFPFWWPIRYLAKVSAHAPDEVLEIVLGLPEVDNPVVNNGILEVALRLRGDQSGSPRSKILEYARSEYQHFEYRYGELLAHWAEEDQVSAALEFLEAIVQFEPDPESEDKRERRGKDPEDEAAVVGTSLEPSPRMGQWEYEQLLEQGVRPLAEKAPYRVARILIDATARMVDLKTHDGERGGDEGRDFSEIWCRRLDGDHQDYENSQRKLVRTLTSVCVKVFEQEPESIGDLNEYLHGQRWKVFERLRQHLYALYPSEQTKPWICDLILGHGGYSQWEHRYEFQQMIRKGCEHFQEELLTREEREEIFGAILGGPSRERYREWMEEEGKTPANTLFCLSVPTLIPTQTAGRYGTLRAFLGVHELGEAGGFGDVHAVADHRLERPGAA